VNGSSSKEGSDGGLDVLREWLVQPEPTSDDVEQCIYGDRDQQGKPDGWGLAEDGELGCEHEQPNHDEGCDEARAVACRQKVASNEHVSNLQ